MYIDEQLQTGVLCYGDQIGVVTWYGFMATAIIIILPLVTEFYELRKFMLERASVEPDEIDLGLPNSPPPPNEDVPAASDQCSPLKPMKSATNGGRLSASEMTVEYGNATQTDTV